MGNKISIFQIDAFTEKPFCGNPAGVTYSNGLSSELMQNIAKEMNLSETAFLSNSQIADYNLRWFTPACEVKLCGHATVASLHFLFEEKKLKEGESITFETLSGILKCGLRNGKYFMQIPVYETEVYNGCLEEILSALQIERTDIDYSIPFILCSNGYLYIYLKEFNQLSSVQPDFNTLKKLCNSNLGFNCITIFSKETIEKGNDAHLRFFAPAYGINEDPVTGSANGPLLLVMMKLGLFSQKNNITVAKFEQGDVIGRPGRIEVTFNSKDNDLYIAGNAVTVLKGEIYI